MEKNIVLNGNKLIAKFMDNYQKLSDDPEFGKFHLSWDWLMPVLKKISSIANQDFFSDHYFEFEERFSGEFNPIFRTVEEVHEKTVEFIEWYNKNS